MAEEWSDDEKLRRLLEGLQGSIAKIPLLLEKKVLSFELLTNFLENCYGARVSHQDVLDQLEKTFRRPEESLHVCIENYIRVILRARQLPST